MAAVVLVCPLCAAVVFEGGEPAPGSCQTCGADYAGGGESPPAAVAAAGETWGVAGLPAGDLARRLFEADPAPAPEPTAAIASDRRDGFYRWWVFVRPGREGPGALLRELAERGSGATG